MTLAEILRVMHANSYPVHLFASSGKEKEILNCAGCNLFDLAI